MRTIFETEVSPENAVKLAEKIMEKVGRYLTDPNFGACSCTSSPCTCSGRYEHIIISENEVEITLDWTGASFGVYFEKDVLTVLGCTCGGTNQELDIHLDSGKIQAIHVGKRNSTLGLVTELLPFEWWDNIDKRIETWKLVTYDSAEPSWAAVSCWLVGKVGDGPANLADKINMEAEKKIKLWKLLGINIPDGVSICHGFGVTDGAGKEWKPNLLGVHYRRAAAEGIRI